MPLTIHPEPPILAVRDGNRLVSTFPPTEAGKAAAERFIALRESGSHEAMFVSLEAWRRHFMPAARAEIQRLVDAGEYHPDFDLAARLEAGGMALTAMLAGDGLAAEKRKAAA